MARTLRACTPENVAPLERVAWYYLKRYGATPHHHFAAQLLWVDIDLTPMPIGAKAEGSERPWMGRNRRKTGRKTLRITASPYREILHETLLRGKASAVPPLKMALLARRRCSTGSSAGAIRRWPRSAPAAAFASCARPWVRGSRRRAPTAPSPPSCSPISSVAPRASG
jgi:hypothetical protein